MAAAAAKETRCPESFSASTGGLSVGSDDSNGILYDFNWKH